MYREENELKRIERIFRTPFEGNENIRSRIQTMGYQSQQGASQLCHIHS